jgi:hypothetical protein
MPASLLMIDPILRAEQPAEDEIDDGAGVASWIIGQFGRLGLRAQDHPGHDRPVQAVEQQVDARLSGKVTALERPVQQGPGALDVRGEDLGGEPRVQRRDDGGLEVNPEERPTLRCGLVRQQPAGVLDEIGSQVAGVLDTHAAGLRAQGGQKEVFLRLPPQVERGLADAGPARDGVEAEAGPPRLRVEPKGRGENPSLEMRVPGTPGAAPGLGNDRRAQPRSPNAPGRTGSPSSRTAPSALKTPTVCIMHARWVVGHHVIPASGAGVVAAAAGLAHRGVRRAAARAGLG